MGGCPDSWAPDASSQAVLSFPCGHQVEGEENCGGEGLQGQKGSKWGKIPVVTGCPERCTVPPFLLWASPRKAPRDGPSATSQVTIIIRHSSQYFPCVNSDNLQTHFTDGEFEAEKGCKISPSSYSCTRQLSAGTQTQLQSLPS